MKYLIVLLLTLSTFASGSTCQSADGRFSIAIGADEVVVEENGSEIGRKESPGIGRKGHVTIQANHPQIKYMTLNKSLKYLLVVKRNGAKRIKIKCN